MSAEQLKPIPLSVRLNEIMTASQQPGRPMEPQNLTTLQALAEGEKCPAVREGDLLRFDVAEPQRYTTQSYYLNNRGQVARFVHNYDHSRAYGANPMPVQETIKLDYDDQGRLTHRVWRQKVAEDQEQTKVEEFYVYPAGRPDEEFTLINMFGDREQVRTYDDKQLGDRLGSMQVSTRPGRPVEMAPLEEIREIAAMGHIPLTITELQDGQVVLEISPDWQAFGHLYAGSVFTFNAQRQLTKLERSLYPHIRTTTNYYYDEQGRLVEKMEMDYDRNQQQATLKSYEEYRYNEDNTNTYQVIKNNK